MVNFYYAIDILFIVVLIYLTYKSYKNKIYLKIFTYFKIFLLITISAKLSSTTGLYLQKLYITKADTYTTLILIGFSINLAILYFSWKYIFKYTDKFINSRQIRQYFAMTVSLSEVLIITTFSTYIFMQTYMAKKYIYKHISQTFGYPKIERFYMNFLNDRFVNMVLNSDTGTNHKEVIFKSFKNSI